MYLFYHYKPNIILYASITTYDFRLRLELDLKDDLSSLRDSFADAISND